MCLPTIVKKNSKPPRAVMAERLRIPREQGGVPRLSRNDSSLGYEVHGPCILTYKTECVEVFLQRSVLRREPVSRYVFHLTLCTTVWEDEIW